jgi:tetratricopeptide (TPR) repeat protein
MSDIDARLARADHLLADGHWQEASEIALSVLAVHPDSVAAHRVLVAACVWAGDLTGALSNATDLVRLDPSDPGNHRRRAEVLARLLRHDEAVASADMAVRLGPQDVANWMALSYALLGRDRMVDVRAAANAATSARRIAPDEAAVHVLTGQIHARMEDRAAQVASYRQALELDPRNVAALNDLALLAAERGRAGRAATELEALLAEHPDQTVVEDNLNAVAVTILWRFGWAAVAAALVVAAVARIWPQPRAVVGLVIVAAFLAGSSWIVSRMRPLLRHALWRQATNVSGMRTVAMILLSGVIVAMAAFLPSTDLAEDRNLPLKGAAVLVLIFGVFGGVVRAFEIVLRTIRRLVFRTVLRPG